MGNEDADIIVIDDDSNLDTKPAAQDVGTQATKSTSPTLAVSNEAASGEVTLSVEIVAGMRRRIEELEKENERLKGELSRARWPISSSISKLSASSSSGPVPKKPKLTAAASKKHFEKWARALAKAVPREKFGMCGSEKKVVIKDNAAMTKEQFEELFKDRGGQLIQPTPANKPTSVITIIRFKDYAAIKALFGEADIPEAGYTANVWRQRSFQKAMKCGERDAKITDLDVSYNRTKMLVELHFSLDASTGEADDCTIM